MLSKKSDNPPIIDPKIVDNFPIIILALLLFDSWFPTSGSLELDEISLSEVFKPPPPPLLFPSFDEEFWDFFASSSFSELERTYRGVVSVVVNV